MLNKITVYDKNTGEVVRVLSIKASESSDSLSYSEQELKKLKEQYSAATNNIVVNDNEEVLQKDINEIYQKDSVATVVADMKVLNNRTVESLLEERGHTYGDYMTNAILSQKLKSVMRESENWDKISMDKKEAFEMIAVKIARALNGDPTYPDNYRDLAGYATLVADRLQNK